MKQNTIQIFISVDLHSQRQAEWQKFTFETNSTVVQKSADGFSLILPDVRFGSAFQYLVTY